MQLARVDSLKPGQVLGRSLYNERRELQFAVGTQLNREMIDQINRQRFTYVYLWDGLNGDFVSPQQLIGDAIRDSSSKSFAQALDDMRGNEALRKLDPEAISHELRHSTNLRTLLPYAQFEEMAGRILEEVLNDNVRMFSSLPVRSEATADIDHAIDVCVLSVMLGRDLGLPQETLKTLAVSSLLHDAGLWVLAATSKDDPGNLSNDLVEEHPTISMLLFAQAQPEKKTEQVIVHQHHELLDGSGFPEGLQGDDEPISLHSEPPRFKICPLSMIVAAANRYDVLVSGRSGEKLHSPEQALAKLVKDSGVQWNSHVVREMIKVVQLYPMGAHVNIKYCSNPQYNGCGGIVIANSPLEPRKPTIIITHDHRGGATQPRRVVLAREERVELELLL